MTTTTYYNLNIVEGTDIVNPLIVDNPNYEKIDEAMHDNAVAGVTLATEIANATVHAITREKSECAVIRFIATSNWKAGDTVTVDGVPVTALLPSGETLPDGAYVINANILCILTGTNLTVYAERKKIDNATEIAYNDTNVGEAITKLNSDLVLKLTGNYNDYLTVNSNTFEMNTCRLWSSDNLLKLYVIGTVKTPSNTPITVFTMKDKYRPRVSIMGAASCYSHSEEGGVCGAILVDTTGSVSLQHSGSKNFVVFNIDIPLT